MQSKYKYKFIPAGSVSKQSRETAGRTLAWCRRDLQLPQINIHWFSPVDRLQGDIETEQETVGLTRAKEPNTINIRVGMSQEEIIHTVAHETWHLFQYRHKAHEHLAVGEDSYSGRNRWFEKDAEEFGVHARENVDLRDDALYFDHLAGKDYSKRNKKAAAVVSSRKSRAKSGPAAMSDIEFKAHMKWLVECNRREERARREMEKPKR